MQVRDLLRLGPVAVRNKAAAKKAIDLLIEYGWIVEVTKRPHTIRLRSVATVAVSQGGA